jgi:hypothetical protein
MMARHLSLSGLICCATLILGCGGSAKYEWSQASTMNTITAYQTFLSRFPNDAHAADAKNRIAALQDEQAWSTAQVASTAQGYQQYLSVEPNGAHAQAAREEMATDERVAAWRSVQLNETAQSLQAFLQKYPSGREADLARDKLKMIAGYRAELGMARSQGLADRERDSLSKRFGKDLQQIDVLEPDANSHDYRITSAPMSEHDANAACATVKHAGRSCKVVEVTS